MRELLSDAFPPPEDEPLPRDVIEDAMAWGRRRRRLDRVLVGAGAVAVVAVGVGVAALAPGAGPGSRVASGSGGQNVVVGQMTNQPPGSSGGPNCSVNAAGGNTSEYCRLFLEEQRFAADYAKGSVQYIQAALPNGFTVKATDTYVVVLTGPDGKTNYLYPSVTGADTLDGHTPGCGTTPIPQCVQTSTAGGGVVVNNPGPSAEQSAGYVKDQLKDPRISVLVGTAAFGGLNGVQAPTGGQLLTNEQLSKVVGNTAFVDYSQTQYAHLMDIVGQLQKLSPPSATGSSMPSATGSSLPSATGSSMPSSPTGGIPSSPVATHSSGATPVTSLSGTPIHF